MKPIFTILLLFIAAFSYCQMPDTTIDWEKSLGGSNIDRANSIEQTTDGGSIVAGYTQSSDGDVTGFHKNSDVWVVKLDGNGNITWEKSFGGSGYEAANSIKQTYDGGYVFAGFTSSGNGDVSGNHGNNDAWIVKLDSLGNIVWQKCLGTQSNEEAFDIQQTKDSGYVIACAVDSATVIKLNKYSYVQWRYVPKSSVFAPTSIVETLDKGYVISGGYNNKMIIEKIDSAGHYLWNHTADIGYAAEYATKVKLTPKGGFVVVGGYSPYDGADDGGPGGTFAKFDENGNLIVNKAYGGDYSDETFNDIEIVKDSFEIVSTALPYYDPTSSHQGEIYVVYGIDTRGYIHWRKELGGTNGDEASSISCRLNNGCIVAGSSNSKDGDITGNHGNYDFWIVKLQSEAILPIELLNLTVQKQDNAVLIQWQTTNEINNSYFSIERSPDSKLFTSIGNKAALNGSNKNNYSFTDNTPLNDINYYRLKQVDKDGKFTYSNIVSVDFNKSASSFSIYPNPANSSLNITLPSSNSVSDIILYDVNGKKVLQEQAVANTASKQLDISKLASGVYNVVLIQNGKQQTIRIVKK